MQRDLEAPALSSARHSLRAQPRGRDAEAVRQYRNGLRDGRRDLRAPALPRPGHGPRAQLRGWGAGL